MRWLALILALSGASGASAQADDQLRQVQLLALAHIGGAKCTPAKTCEPATEAELENPPLADGIIQQTLAASALSVMSENCGFGHARVFLPYMSKQRKTETFSNRELALIGLIHGVGMSRFEDDERMQCSDRARALLARNGIG